MFRAIPKKDGLGGSSAEEARTTIQTVHTELAKSTPFSRASELLERLNDEEFDPFRIAYNRGVNVSTLFEMLDPSGSHGDTQLDAFERVIRASGMRLSTDPKRGIFASRLQDFEDSLATKRLVPELLARMYRSAVFGTGSENERANPTFLSSDYGPGSIVKPWAQRPGVQVQPIATQIPVSALVAITTGITGDAYRGFYIDRDADSVQFKRISEASELPRTKITGRTQAVSLYKYGRAVEMSYEVLRRMAIDMVAVIVQMMAAQSEVDKLQSAIDVLVAGDGNSNAAASFNLTTLDPTTVADTLTLAAYTAFQLKFQAPYSLNVMLAQTGIAQKVLLLNTGSANIPLATFAGIVGFGGVRPLNRTSDNIGLGWTDLAPAYNIIGIDTSKALERVYEIGASISEVDRFITRQVETLTFSETEGYAILDTYARKLLNTHA